MGPSRGGTLTSRSPKTPRNTKPKAPEKYRECVRLRLMQSVSPNRTREEQRPCGNCMNSTTSTNIASCSLPESDSESPCNSNSGAPLWSEPQDEAASSSQTPL